MKNHALGFEAPYLHQGDERRYRPDFILKIGEGATEPLHLIVEIKGYRQGDAHGGQTRSLVTNVLGRQPGVSPEILQTILENSGKTAKGNITRRTPQLTELIAAVEDWIQPEGVEQHGK